MSFYSISLEIINFFNIIQTNNFDGEKVEKSKLQCTLKTASNFFQRISRIVK